MARPLMQHKIAQLEEMFARSKSETRVLKQLEDELQCRHVPRAVALLAQVQDALRDVASATGAAPQPHESRPVVMQLPSQRPGPAPSIGAPRPVTGATSPTPSPSPGSHLGAAAKPEPQSRVAPEMTVEEACRVLRATPGAAWESIEQARRQLVQQAIPARLAAMSAVERSKVQEAARRANEAYGVLSRQRASGSWCLASTGLAD